MKTKIFLLLSLFVISYSCYKEGPLDPTIDEERVVNIDSLKRQGTNIYQERLIDYFDKYSVLTMYQFDTTLFQYEIVNKPYFRYKTADEANVGTLLDLIDELFYQQIGDKAIIRYSPLNVLLVSDLQKTDANEAYVDSYLGLFCLTFSGADERIKSWDKERKQKYKTDIVYNFLVRMYNRNLIDSPFAFLSISDYSNKGINKNNYMEYGFLSFSQGSGLSRDVDFKDYLLMVISTPTVELTVEGGWLDPNIDKKGVIRKKYDAIVAFYKKYDVDLIKIANYQIK